MWCRYSFLLLVLNGVFLAPALLWAEDPAGAAATADDQAAREAILQSEEWLQLRGSLDEWLSIQKIYSEEQVAQMQAELETQLESMSAEQLEDFMYDLSARLDILMSAEADQARDWLRFFTLEARQRAVAREGEVPNIFETTASQLRQELRQFQQQRAGGAAAQRDFDRLREERVAAALEQQRAVQASQRDSRQRAAANAQQRQAEDLRSPYAPRTTPLPRETNTQFYITPWGGVGIRFNF